MSLGFEVCYLIRPKESLLRLTAENPAPDADWELTTPQVWTRVETTHDDSQTEHRAAYVKLLFLAWLHHSILASLCERPREDSDSRLEKMLGPEPYTPAVFDRWWSIERFDDNSAVENVERLIGVGSLKKIAAPNVDYVARHLHFVLQKKARESGTSQ